MTKPEPTDIQILQVVDAIILGDHLASMGEAELKEARASQPYKAMQRVGIAAFRTAQLHYRPAVAKPKPLKLVKR